MCRKQYSQVLHLLESRGGREHVKQADHLVFSKRKDQDLERTGQGQQKRELCGWLHSTHVLMLHVLEQPELPVSPLSEDLRLERPVELLDGRFLFRPLVYRRAAVKNANTDYLSALATISSFFEGREENGAIGPVFEVSLSA